MIIFIFTVIAYLNPSDDLPVLEHPLYLQVVQKTDDEDHSYRQKDKAHRFE